jgi:hypothetical protein
MAVKTAAPDHCAQPVKVNIFEEIHVTDLRQ